MDFPAAFAAANEAGIEFLKTELRLAHTFLDVAETTTLSRRRLQCRKDALKAHRTVCHFLPRLRLDHAQRRDFEHLMAQLAARLTEAGIELQGCLDR